MSSTVGGAATYEASIVVEPGVKTLDLITLHAHAESGSTLTASSLALRLKLD